MPGNTPLLKITPVEFNFPPPLNQVLTRIFTLSNPSKDYHVAYKVKTTAPKRYCVRPTSGVLHPGEVGDVQVIFSPSGDVPNQEQEDKFQVWSLLVTGPVSNVADLWATKSKPDCKQMIKAHFYTVDTSGRPIVPSNKATPTTTAASEEVLGSPATTIGKAPREIQKQEKTLSPRSLVDTPAAVSSVPVAHSSLQQQQHEENERKLMAQLNNVRQERDSLSTQMAMLSRQLKNQEEREREKISALDVQLQKARQTVAPPPPNPGLSTSWIFAALVLLFMAMLYFYLRR